MRHWALVVLAAVVAITLGCGQTENGDGNGDGNGNGNGDGGGAATGTATGAEAAAKAMLEGFSKGDYGTFLDHVDLKGIYEGLPEEAHEQMTYEAFEEQFRGGMAEAPEAPEGWEYKIVGSKKEGDTTIVTVRIKEDANAEWDESKVPFKKIDGKWKITAEGMNQLMEE